MSPIVQAAELCRARGANFCEELEAHLLHGVVICKPDAFLMGRPVPKGAEIRDVWQTWPRKECDAWFVWLGVGDAWRLLSLMPYPLPWVGWNRQGRGWARNHWVRTERFESALVSNFRT